MKKRRLLLGFLVAMAMSAYSTWAADLQQIMSTVVKLAEVASGSVFGQGSAAGVAGVAGVGGSMSLEVMNFGKYGVFCVPAVDVQSDVGVSALLSKVVTFGCSSNSHYSGGFVTGLFSISGEVIGAPVGVYGSFSIGVNYESYAKELKAAVRAGDLDPVALAIELTSLANESRAITSGNPQHVLGRLLALSATNLIVNRKDVSKWIQGAMQASMAEYLRGKRNGFTVAAMSRALSRGTEGLIRDLEAYYGYRYPNLTHSLRLFQRSLTGCNGLALGTQAALSVSPVAFGLEFSHYVLLAEMDYLSFFDGTLLRLPFLFRDKCSADVIGPRYIQEALRLL